MTLSSWLEEYPKHFPSGYMSPSGEFFYADYLEHWALADEICDWFHYESNNDPQAVLLEHGWVHLTRSTIMGCMVIGYGKLTDIQKIELKPLLENLSLPLMASEKYTIGRDFPDIDIWYMDI